MFQNQSAHYTVVAGTVRRPVTADHQCHLQIGKPGFVLMGVKEDGSLPLRNVTTATKVKKAV